MANYNSTHTGLAIDTAVGAVASKAPLVHTHVKADITDLPAVAVSGAYNDLTGKPTLGTASVLDVPATGDALSTEVVKGSDSRLTNARTPTAHTHVILDVTGLQTTLDGKASSVHSHAISDVTGLQTALDGKSATSHTHTGVYEPANINIQSHISATNNPHSTTAAQVGAYTTTQVDVLLTGKADTSHTHSNATTLVAGFMSALDKTKLDGVEAGAQVNTVTSVAGKTGVVTLVKADVGLGSVDNTSDATKVVLSASKLTTARTIAGVSFDGTANIDISYTDLTNKPKRYLNAILSDASTAITNATSYITPVEIPVAGTVTSIRARTATGTVSVQFKRNGVTLGTAVAATTSGVSQVVSQAVVAGDLITVDTSSASGNGLTISVEIN